MTDRYETFKDLPAFAFISPTKTNNLGKYEYFYKIQQYLYEHNIKNKNT